MSTIKGILSRLFGAKTKAMPTQPAVTAHSPQPTAASEYVGHDRPQVLAEVAQAQGVWRSAGEATERSSRTLTEIIESVPKARELYEGFTASQNLFLLTHTGYALVDGNITPGELRVFLEDSGVDTNGAMHIGNYCEMRGHSTQFKDVCDKFRTGRSDQIAADNDRAGARSREAAQEFFGSRRPTLVMPATVSRLLEVLPIEQAEQLRELQQQDPDALARFPAGSERDELVAFAASNPVRCLEGLRKIYPTAWDMRPGQIVRRVTSS